MMRRPRPQYYHLIGRLPVPVFDMITWAKGADFGGDAWRVAKTTVRAARCLDGLSRARPQLVTRSRRGGGPIRDDDFR